MMCNTSGLSTAASSSATGIVFRWFISPMVTLSFVAIGSVCLKLLCVALQEFPRSLYGCPYPAQPNGQVGACLPPPQCNCANGVCYGSC